MLHPLLLCFLVLLLLIFVNTASARIPNSPLLTTQSNPLTATRPPKLKSNETTIFFTRDAKGNKRLTYYGLMLAGAVARSVSAAAVHPLNVIKTMLQVHSGKMPEFKWSVLSRGAGSQLIMSVPHGAFSFAVTEVSFAFYLYLSVIPLGASVMLLNRNVTQSTKSELAKLTSNSTLSTFFSPRVLNPLLDLLSSAISTTICSVISTPQMVITDRIMAGVYTNFFVAVYSIARNEGMRGFYLGWFPALVQKIPSYALTWMFFQQLKAVCLLLFLPLLFLFSSLLPYGSFF